MASSSVHLVERGAETLQCLLGQQPYLPQRMLLGNSCLDQNVGKQRSPALLLASHSISGRCPTNGSRVFHQAPKGLWTHGFTLPGCGSCHQVSGCTSATEGQWPVPTPQRRHRPYRLIRGRDADQARHVPERADPRHFPPRQSGNHARPPIQVAKSQPDCVEV